MIRDRVEKPDRVEAETLALRALAFIIGDEELGRRFLAVTGLTVATLREQAGDPALLSATLAFLEAHEPTLTACATALGVPPERLVEAHAALG